MGDGLWNWETGPTTGTGWADEVYTPLSQSRRRPTQTGGLSHPPTHRLESCTRLSTLLFLEVNGVVHHLNLLKE